MFGFENYARAFRGIKEVTAENVALFTGAERTVKTCFEASENWQEKLRKGFAYGRAGS